MFETRAHLWVAMIVACAVVAGGLVVVNLTGWGTFFGLALAGVILLFVVWVLYSQFDWRRTQVSLSMALVLMFVAGGLLWANTRANVSQEVISISYTPNDPSIRAQTIDYGWPFAAFIQYKPVVGEKGVGRETVQPEIVLNLAIALAILYAVWLMRGWRTRQRRCDK